MRYLFMPIAAFALISSAHVKAKKQPAQTGIALQQIQSRDYEVGKEVSFPAVMTVLQDAGYRIAEADKDTGLITGAASTKSATTYNIFWGLGKKKHTPVVSAFVEDRGRGSRVRLNFVLTTTKSRIYGVGSADEEPITDPAIYRDAFERIEKEIFVRQALNSPVPRAAPVTPQTAGAQSSPSDASRSSAQTTSTGLRPYPADMPPALKPDPKPQQ